MVSILFAFFSFLVLSPLSAQGTAGTGSNPLGEYGDRPAFPAEARQGDAEAVWIPRQEGQDGFLGEAILRSPDGVVLQKTTAVRLSAAPSPGWDVCVLAVPMDAPPGLYTVELRGSRSGSGWMASAPLSVRERNYLSEDIPLNYDLTSIRTEATPRKEAESRVYAEILSRVDGNGVWLDGPFIRPVASERRTSYFGDRRRYIYATGGSANGIHAGIDFAAPTGTPVLAAGRGRVVLASDREATGNTVILEHLPGVYTIYMHMDSLAVSRDTVVERGASLGTVGSTGLATGPHLHWELRVRGEACDPESPAFAEFLSAAPAASAAPAQPARPGPEGSPKAGVASTP